MISLDENYFGKDNQSILIRAIKVCAGILCVLDNNSFLGAHLTTLTTVSEFELGCTRLINQYVMPRPPAPRGNITAIYLVLNQEEWASQPQSRRYSDLNLLVADLKRYLHFRGPVMVCNKNHFSAAAGSSVDYRISALGLPWTPILEYRLTPEPDSSTGHNNNVGINLDIFQVATANDASMLPEWRQVGIEHPRRIPNRVPDNQGGFNLIQLAMFDPY